MHLRAKFTWTCLLLIAPASGATPSYQIVGEDAGAWPQILSSIGLSRAADGPAKLAVIRNVAPAAVPEWLAKVEKGSLLVTEGDNRLAAAIGIKPTEKRVTVRSVVDRRAPKLPIIWQNALDLPVFEVPKGAQILAFERWEHAPLMVAIHHGAGAILWIATSPGEQGYERFPYLLQALSELGVQPPFRSERLWAFFDGSYRSRVDLDYFADRWRQAGIAALHVAGWHYFEENKENDEYLRRLIEACHRKAILVYVWLELPHVSEKFWADHPDWREQTALLQDAQLDWRRLMNLTNRDCFRAVAAGVKTLIGRFDWDGVNLAELYFESLEGASNAARFTPMNSVVREEFRGLEGFDPLELFQGSAPDAQRLRKFLDYRAELTRRQQEEWIAQIEFIRASKPDLDFVVTHVDDRFDTRMRDLIGADAARVLPLLDQHDFTFLIEDPATIWNLGPQRYPQIASRYQPLTKHNDKLAIDINIVERYQDVYPTKQQTGTELFQLVHLAANSFPQVALYFENSILAADLPLLSAAAAGNDKVDQDGSKLIVDSRYGVGIPWQGAALVNGGVWPVHNGTTLWLPAGHNVVEQSQKDSTLRILDFNGKLKSARGSENNLTFSYESTSRAVAMLSSHPQAVEIDGAAAQPEVVESGPNFVMLLPRGQHVVQINASVPVVAASKPAP